MAKRKKVAKKRKAAKKKKVARRRRKGLWSDDETKVLKKRFSTTLTAEIAKELGRPTDAVKKKASRMGLRKSKRYLRSIGRA